MSEMVGVGGWKEPNPEQRHMTFSSIRKSLNHKGVLISGKRQTMMPWCRGTERDPRRQSSQQLPQTKRKELDLDYITGLLSDLWVVSPPGIPGSPQNEHGAITVWCCQAAEQEWKEFSTKTESSYPEKPRFQALSPATLMWGLLQMGIPQHSVSTWARGIHPLSHRYTMRHPRDEPRSTPAQRVAEESQWKNGQINM